MQTVKQPWSLPFSDVLKALKTSEKGISNKEAEIRISKYGDNTFRHKEKVNFLTLFLKQFISPLIFLLLGAALLTGILHEWLDMGVILFAVLLNVILGFYHEYHAESTLDKLKTYIKDRARVIREGIEEEIDSSLVVPGDIIKLSYGTRIPVDTRIISVNNFQVDEAILTGESIPVPKKEEIKGISTPVAERKNIAHAGTLVVQGYALGVAYATGSHTEIGKIAKIVSKISRIKTPLQKGIDQLAWFIFLIVSVVVLGIFILGILRGEPIVEMLLLSSAVAVGAVPESLPIALTLILAIGSLRIAKKKGIIRKLTAAETLGSTTLIMTDKTGTLTLGNMQLTGVYDVDTIFSSTSSSLKEDTLTREQKSLLRLALINADVSIENPNEDKAKWLFRGKPFEVNIVKACRAHNISIDSLLSYVSYIILPFNSTNKFSVSEKDGTYTLMGAPDILLKKSSLSKEKYLKIESWIEKNSRDGKRLIGIATMPKKHNKKHFSISDVKDVDFLGVFTFFDPIRPEVPAAISNIESHGIKMVLVTGDLIGTAFSVAKDLNWNVHKDEAL